MLSKLDKRCEDCKYRDTCNNKRMCAMATAPVQQEVLVSYVAPSFEENIREELKKSLTKELRCGFNRR